jgi:hypothetical protein
VVGANGTGTRNVTCFKLPHVFRPQITQVNLQVSEPWLVRNVDPSPSEIGHTNDQSSKHTHDGVDGQSTQQVFIIRRVNVGNIQVV